MELDLDGHKTINGIALHELAILSKVSEEDLDKCIIRVRDEFMKYEDEQISEAIPKIMKGYNVDDVMLGAIIMIFISDYVFNEFLSGDLDGI